MFAFLHVFAHIRTPVFYHIQKKSQKYIFAFTLSCSDTECIFSL